VSAASHSLCCSSPAEHPPPSLCTPRCRSAYWLSTFLFDCVTYIIPALLSILICAAFDVKEFISRESSRLGATVLLFALYGTSVAAFTYCLTYLFQSHSTAQNVVLFVVSGAPARIPFCRRTPPTSPPPPRVRTCSA